MKLTVKDIRVIGDSRFYKEKFKLSLGIIVGLGLIFLGSMGALLASQGNSEPRIYESKYGRVVEVNSYKVTLDNEILRRTDSPEDTNFPPLVILLILVLLGSAGYMIWYAQGKSNFKNQLIQDWMDGKLDS